MNAAIKHPDRLRRRLALLPALGLLAPLAGRADGGKTMHFVVPYPPGGPTDLLARMLQPELQARLGVTVIIDNRSGAGGNVGTDLVAKSAPDGHTILLASPGPMAVNPSLFKSMPYDPQRDLAPVIQISKFPLVLVVNPQLPVRNIGEFLAYVRARPSDLTFGSAGNGTPQHLVGMLFNAAAGVAMRHVPYKGAGPALTDLMGGQISLMFDILGSSIGHIRSGRLRALAVTTKTRSAVLPEVPTLAESGLPGFDFSAWHGIAVAAATPPAIVERLNRTFNEIFAEPAIRKQWEALGTPVVGGSPAQFAALIRYDAERLGKLVREAGVTLD
ncbi:MAG: tripartite tricarboxylate transporter substrate binding protein [Burkholderiales bacterium]|nr:tripartite tricarboxylate transporter substrate binding protein [Burkholderiales bacterium]